MSYVLRRIDTGEYDTGLWADGSMEPEWTKDIRHACKHVSRKLAERDLNYLNERGIEIEIIDWSKFEVLV